LRAADGRSGHPRQTIDAAWQLFADDVTGSLRSASTPTWWCCRPIRAPLPPETIADLKVRATFRRVGRFYRNRLTTTVVVG